MNEVIFADVEASGLINGFPVEIGWAWREGQKVESASVLIAPPQGWLNQYLWDPEAEAVHGISKEHLLLHGDSLRYACDTLNMALDGRDLVFDTGRDGVDTQWMQMLYTEAGRSPTFGVLSTSSEDLVRSRAAYIGLSNEVYACLQEAAPRITHRAAADAAYWAWWLIALDIASEHVTSPNLSPDMAESLLRQCSEVVINTPRR